MTPTVEDVMINGLLHLPIRGAALRMAVFQQIAALDAAGFVIAPKRATEQMEAAARKFVRGYHDVPEEYIRSSVPKDIFRLAWKAMLAARPQSTSGGER